MNALRKRHNVYKNELIQNYIKPGMHVLDCGCGHGGDFGKWKRVGAHITAVDPDQQSLEEAARRAQTYELDVQLFQGDVSNTSGLFDAVCYNFSIHYIRDTLDVSVRYIAKRVRPGGILFGITPDEHQMKTFKSPDMIGNTLRIENDRAYVQLVDGPFYASGEREEPLMSKDILVGALGRWFVCELWEPMCTSSGLISDIYSKFVFRRKNVPA